MLVEDGKVARLGDAETLLGEIGEVEVFEYRDALITHEKFEDLERRFQ